MSVDTRERLDILQDISKSWLALEKVIGRLSDEQISKPARVGEWSVKDVMAHITFWESRLTQDVKLLEQGQQPPEDGDYEATNREQANKSRSASLGDVRAQFGAVHDDVMRLLEASQVLSRELVAGNTYDHYNEHLDSIKAAFPQ